MTVGYHGEGVVWVGAIDEENKKNNVEDFKEKKVEEKSNDFSLSEQIFY